MKDKNYLQHQKLSGRTRDNPLGNADFDSLASRAQKMSKEYLEDYFISDNANGKTPCSEIIFRSVMIGLALFAVVFLLANLGYDIAQDDLSSNLEEVSEDICKYLPDDYSSTDLLTSRFFGNYKEQAIVCP
jgi:hypothetical protein